MNFVGHFNLVWNGRDLDEMVVMEKDDYFTVSIRQSDVGVMHVAPPLQVESVAHVGRDSYKYTIGADEPIRFPIGLLVAPLLQEFDEFRMDLLNFYAYRQKILDDLSSRGEQPPAP